MKTSLTSASGEKPAQQFSLFSLHC